MNKKHKTAIWYYGLSGLLPMIIMLSLYAWLKIVPFGQHNLLISDLGTQYIPFLAEFKRQIGQLNFSSYSFSLSLGANMLPLAAYYLISPFNLLLLFCSNSQLPVVVGYVIVLKISAMGLTMAHFLKTRQSEYHFSALIFATAYSLSGFVAMNFYNLMWLDALILLPLVILGLEQLFYRRQPNLYIGMLTATILTNYYLGYMTCLFVVLYLISLLIKEQQPNQSWKQLVSQRWSTICQFGWASLIAGGTAAIVLIPALLGMLKTGKKTIAATHFYPTLKFGGEVLSQFQVGGSQYAQRLIHEPSLFISTLGLLFAVAYFCLPTIKRQAKWSNGFLVSSLGLSFWVTTLNTIWHMFQQPAGFPYRNTYLLSFVLLKIAYEASVAPTGQRQTKKLVIWLVWGLFSIGQLALYYGPQIRGVQKQPLWLLMGLTLVASAIFYIWQKRTRWQFWVIGIGAILTFSELFINARLAMRQLPLGNQAVYVQQYRQQARLLKQLEKRTPNFYRVNNQAILLRKAFNEPYFGYNDALLFGQYTFNSYSSTLDEQMRSMLVKLGFYSKNARRINGIGHTQITDLLFANRYDLVDKQGRIQVKKHQTLGLGFAVNARLTQVALKAGAPFENQTQVMQAMTNQTAPFYHVDRLVMQQQKSTQVTFKTQIRTSGAAYLYLPRQAMSKVKLQVNGQLHKIPIHLKGATIIGLGRYQKGQPLTLTISGQHPQAFRQVQVASLDQNQFKQAFSQLAQQRLTVNQSQLSADNGRISGQITVKRPHQLLYLSVPYDSGWHAEVNQHTVRPQSVMGNMLAIPLESGSNQVHLVYCAPGLVMGALITIFSLLIWIITYFKRH
ncbi:YfhO family protein [Latilactobacillus graminis]|uniref:YfhO family protein n=1 Tax=Latilactobacillus graminis TaxID=60519 RepID=A0ABX6C8S4_9LACO|nr:YfhO family protein [Latilactobacillus graminis]QFP79404.1 YfhO family protein [Latilactobacillus graminis]